MALQKKVFRTRAITAVIFALVMLAGLFINAWTFITLFTIILFGSIYEFFRLVKKITPRYYWLALPLSVVYIAIPVWMMLDLGINFETPHTIGPLVAKPLISYSPLIPCAIIFSIWINDTMAYIVGSMIGRTPFSKISPKKTWEGTIGGAVLCIGVIVLLSQLLEVARPLALHHWIIIAALCAVFGTLGDLLESKLKRMAGIKDSGSFMPGHGGFLDRFDSFLIAAPAVWLYLHFSP